ncbi:MAG TPA: hypothetical protein VGL56_18125 [Fimbriimonadaceae bacterium]|jgi:hypothetical protein
MRVKVLALLAVTAASVCVLGQSGKPDIEQRLNKDLKLTESQKSDIDPIIERHEQDIAAIKQDPVLTKNGKHDRIRENLEAMGQEIEPFLKKDQISQFREDLNEMEGRKGGFLGLGIHPVVNASYDQIFPSSSATRAIFGNSPYSYGFGVGLASKDTKRLRMGFDFDFYALSQSQADFYVLSPQAFAEYRVPLARDFRAFGRIAGGPAYMDYRLNTPIGLHYAAKRIGADAEAEVGLRFGPAQVGLTYRAVTQTSPINFSGFELSASVIVLRF